MIREYEVDVADPSIAKYGRDTDTVTQALSRLSVQVNKREAPDKSVVDEAIKLGLPIGIVTGRVIRWFDDAHKKKTLGRGALGEVVAYEAVGYSALNDMVAVKIVSNTVAGVESNTLGEMAAMSGLEHPNVLRLLDVFTSSIGMCLVLPLAETTLYDMITDMNLMEKKRAIAQIIRGVMYLHSKDILHGDLKPENTLVMRDTDGTTRYVIADFGLAATNRCFARGMYPQVFTLYYRAPELLLGGSYGIEADTWAIGCIAGQLLSGRQVFPGDSPLDMLFRMFRVFGTPAPDTWLGIENYREYRISWPMWKASSNKKRFGLEGEDLAFVSKMLVLDPSKRVPLSELLLDPYLRDAVKEFDIVPGLRAGPIGSEDCEIALIGREAAATGDIVGITLQQRNLLEREFKRERISEKVIDLTHALGSQLYYEYAAANSEIFKSDMDVTYFSRAAAVLTSHLTEKVTSDVSPNEEDLYADKIRRLLIQHGPDLYVATGYDIVNLLAHSYNKVVGDVARTLLQCSYHTPIMDKYRASVIAFVCLILALEYTKKEREEKIEKNDDKLIEKHRKLANPMRVEINGAIGVLCVGFRELWVSNGTLVMSDINVDTWKTCNRGVDVVDILTKTSIIASLMELV